MADGPLINQNDKSGMTKNETPTVNRIAKKFGQNKPRPGAAIVRKRQP